MKQKKSILAVIFSLIFSIFFLSGELFAYDESDLKKLKSTKKCKNCMLERANLRKRNLRYADLSGANLVMADLRRANLRGANLNGANLTMARLDGTNLMETDLSQTNLSDTDLSSADLTNAILKETPKKKEIPKWENKGMEGELGLFYESYVSLKRCREVRKGYEVVHVNSVEMEFILSKAKSIENGIFKQVPKLKPMKEEIWNRFTKVLPDRNSYNYAGKSFSGYYFGGVIPMTGNYPVWAPVCDNYKNIYSKLIRKYGGGGTAEKDF